ncbi:MAG TPA: BlaI/MecI/CopY family transcriptional regulator [Vicinamibacteria bacterium]|nr:BlaI/MecI/CopY family transcriptional regulator [Vicinamibacteria bacterium]
MGKKTYQRLSNRERQIMDVLYRLGQATAVEVLEALPDPPSYSAVRATLRILEDKGQVRHDEEGPRYVFRPAVGRDRAKRTAVRHLVSTFFGGSPSAAMATLLDESASKLSDTDYERLRTLIDEAKNKGDRE